jgi:hypothetical protein
MAKKPNTAGAESVSLHGHVTGLRKDIAKFRKTTR